MSGQPQQRDREQARADLRHELIELLNAEERVDALRDDLRDAEERAAHWHTYALELQGRQHAALEIARQQTPTSFLREILDALTGPTPAPRQLPTPPGWYLEAPDGNTPTDPWMLSNSGTWVRWTEAPHEHDGHPKPEGPMQWLGPLSNIGSATS